MIPNGIQLYLSISNFCNKIQVGCNPCEAHRIPTLTLTRTKRNDTKLHEKITMWSWLDDHQRTSRISLLTEKKKESTYALHSFDHVSITLQGDCLCFVSTHITFPVIIPRKDFLHSELDMTDIPVCWSCSLIDPPSIYQFTHRLFRWILHVKIVIVILLQSCVFPHPATLTWLLSKVSLRKYLLGKHTGWISSVLCTNSSSFLNFL